MVVASFEARKLWKTVRMSGKAMKHKIESVFRRKRRSKKQKHTNKMDIPRPLELHYPFSDDEDADSIMRRRLRRFNAKLMACIFGIGSSDDDNDIERRRRQFVYVTDLYSCGPSKPTTAAISAEDDENMELKKKTVSCDGSSSGAGGGSSEAKGKEVMDAKMKGKAEASPSLGSLQTADAKNAMIQHQLYMDFNGKVDADAERFIAKFYHDMELQRQKSIVEYYEMLDRGAS